VRGPDGVWKGFLILAVTPAAGPRALPFNVSVDAVAAPPTCAGGGRAVAWRAALVATARVVVVACGAEEERGGGREVFAATLAVLPAATLRVRFVVGAVTVAAFTPAVRAGFVVAAARRLKIDELQIQMLLVSWRMWVWMEYSGEWGSRCMCRGGQREGPSDSHALSQTDQPTIGKTKTQSESGWPGLLCCWHWPAPSEVWTMHPKLLSFSTHC
jgi:hypothetical protein